NGRRRVKLTFQISLAVYRNNVKLALRSFFTRFECAARVVSQAVNFLLSNAARIDLSGAKERHLSHTQKVLIVPEEPKTKSVTYADADVDISGGDRAKERIKYLAQKTFNRNVLGGIGGFGALFRLDLQRWKNPILVSSADGVGTKLKIAFELGMHHTVGA